MIPLLLFGCQLEPAKFGIINWQIVDRVRVDRSTVEITYQADLSNDGAIISGATAFALGAGSGTEIIDPTLRFGKVGSAASATSIDTFTIRQDRTIAFDPNSLHWVVLAYGPETQVARTRVDRRIVEFTYETWLENLGTSPIDLSAKGQSTSPVLIVQEGFIEATALPPGRTRTTDTFTIRQDRTVPFDPDTLRFELIQGDRTAPSVVMTAPSAVQPSQAFRAQAMARDDVAVRDVQFFVDGLLVKTLSAPPYELSYNAPGEAGVSLSIDAIARDAAGNEGSASVLVAVVASDDTLPPVIERVQVPAKVAPGERFAADSSVQDDRGVANVCFALAGSLPVCDSTEPYQVVLEVPGEAIPGALLGVSVNATDLSGNAASGGAETEVVDLPDQELPTEVTVSAPTEAYPGQPVLLTATAIDDVGILEVAFLADGLLLARDTEAPYEVLVAIPADKLPGSSVTWRAVASDFSESENSTSSPPALTAIVARSGGFVVGEVYDAYFGVPIVDASAWVVTPGTGSGNAPDPILTDPQGRYRLSVGQGQVWIEIGAEGYTSAFRQVTVPAGGIVEPLDARLMPLGVQALADPLADRAATLENGTALLRVAAGALPAGTALWLTELDPQSLPLPLPLGWSVDFAVDVRTDGAFSGVPLRLELTLGEIAPSAFFASFDPTRGEWLRVPEAQIHSGDVVQVEATAPGALALVRPDQLLQAVPEGGEALLGVIAVPVAQQSTAVLDPSPRVLFTQPRARSVVSATLDSLADALPSGTRVEVTFREAYEFGDGSTLAPEYFRQDVLLYQAEQGLSGAFPATPSVVFEPGHLQQGRIDLAAEATSESSRATVLPFAGGTLVGADGSALTLLEGALSGPAPVSFHTLPPSVGITRPGAFNTLASFEVYLGGETLLSSARLEWSPAELPPPTAQLLLVREVEALGATHPHLVGLPRIEGDRIVVDDSAPGLVFPGLRRGGRYHLIAMEVPLAFVSGQVSLGGAPPTRALVSAQGLPFVSLLEGGEQGYTVAARLAETGVSGVELVSGSSATASVSPTVAGEVIPLALALEAVGLSVSAVTPADESVEVSTTEALSIQFTRSLDPSSLAAGIRLLEVEAGQPVSARVQLDAAGSEARLVPDVPLEGERGYTLRITSELRSRFGDHFVGDLLDGSFESGFTTRDTTPHPRPEAGTIVAGEPMGGKVWVTGTQGSVEPFAVVSVPIPSGTTTSTVAEANGSFSLQVDAGLLDDLKLLVTDAAGNTGVLVNLGRPTPPEGFAVLGHDGGLIEREDGLAAVIPVGFLPEDSIVSIEPADMSAITTTPFADPADGYIAGAVSLDIGGTEIGSVARVSFSVDGFPRFKTVDTMPPFFEVDRTLDLPAELQTGDVLIVRMLAINEFGDEVELTAELPIVAATPDATPRTERFENTMHLALTLPTSAVPGQTIPIRAAAEVPDIKLRFPADAELTGAEQFLLYDVREIAGHEVWDLVTSANLVQQLDGSRVIETNSPPYRGVRRDTSRLVLAVQLQVAHSFAQLAGSMAGFGIAQGVKILARGYNSLNQAFLGTQMIHQFSRPRPVDLEVTEFGVIPLPAGQPATLQLVDLDTNAILYSAELAALPPGEFSEVIVLGEDSESDLLVTSTNSTANASVPLDGNFTLTFSHIVNLSTITDQSLKLIDLTTGSEVLYELLESDGGDVVAIVINPLSKLKAGHDYEIVASSAIERVGGGKTLASGFNLKFKTADAAEVIGQIRIPGATDFDVIPHDYGLGEDENLALVSAYNLGGGLNGLVSVDISDPTMPMEAGRAEFDETHSGRTRGVAGIPAPNLPGQTSARGDLAALTIGAADVFSSVRLFEIEQQGSLAPRAGALVSSPSGALIDSAGLLVMPNVNIFGAISSIEVADVYEGLFDGIPKTPAIPGVVQGDGGEILYFVNQGIGLMTLDLDRSIPTPPIEERGTQFGPSFIPADKAGAVVVSPDPSLLVQSPDVEITSPAHLTLLEDYVSSLDRYVVISGKLSAKDADRLLVNGVEAEIDDLPAGADPNEVPRDFRATIGLREGFNTVVATPFASGAELAGAQIVLLLPFSRNPLEGPGTVTLSLPPLGVAAAAALVTASVDDVTKFDKLFVNGELVSEKTCPINVINPANDSCDWSGTGSTVVALEPGANAVVATAIDVDENFFGESVVPGEHNPFGRTYFDMRVAEGLVLAVRDDLFIYDASGLVEIATVGERLERAFRVSVAAGVFVDVDGDGKTPQAEEKDGDSVYAFDEIRNLALVGTGAGNKLVFVDITEPHKAEVIGWIDAGQPVYRADVLTTSGVAYVAAGSSVLLVDLSRASHEGPLDTDGDGVDDRILKTIDVAGARDVKLDPSLGLAYVLQQNIGLTILDIEDCATDIGVDLTRVPTSRTIRINKLKEERKKLYEGFTEGIGTEDCSGFGYENVAILSQGSSACVWSKGEPRCSTAFQPGISDHDFEFIYSSSDGSLADAQNCTRALENKILEKLPGADVGVFPVLRESFKKAYLPVKRFPLPAGCGVAADPFGDGCLGRNGLMHKWLLEGEWVQGFRNGVSTGQVWNQGMSLDEQLELLASPLGAEYLIPTPHTELSHVPLLEGYEWAVLQKYRVEETLARIRILGSKVRNPDVVDPKLITKIHKVGKAAIRTVLGALLASREGNDLLFESNRRDYRSRDGCLTKTLTPESVNSLSDFTRKPCETYEEYVASKAIEACVEGLGVPALACPGDALLAYEFFRIKSDVGPPPLTEEDINSFIGRAIDYVDGVLENSVVRSAFDTSVDLFRDASDRHLNVSEAKRLTRELVPGGAKFKVKIPARLYNRGYGVAAPQRVDLYHDGELVQSDRIVIGPPGGSRFLAKRFAVEAKVPAGGAAVSAVGLLLDPDDDVVEYDERNNWDGFFYYVLDDSCVGGWPTCGVPSAPNGQSRPERPDGESPEASEVCLGSNGEVPDSPGLEISSDVNGLGTFAFETDPPESLEQTFYIRNTGNTSVQNIVVLSSDGVPIPGVPSSLAAGAQVEVTRTLPELDAKVATQMLATVSGTTADGYGVGATSTITRAVPIQGFADLESEPIIFVPGMAGSRIDGPGLSPKNYWPDVGLEPSKHRSLTLDEDSSHFESGLYATAPLETVALFDVYGKFITALENGSAPGQERRPRFPNDRIIDRECPTPGGEGQNSVGSSKLFVFPYDWRRSNADHVEHLDWLVDCVASLHPDLRIHMVGHSMGGLLARRYAMEHPGRISKVVTIGTPWLGAPKVLMTLLTGDFLGWVQSFIITEEDLRFVAQSTPGPHELMPSRAYFEELGGRPFKDLGRSYDYPDYAFIHDQVLNRRFRPASTMEAFHDFENAGSHQDDWRKERTFAEYFHVYGVKDGPPSTIESIILQDDVVPLLEAETGLEIQSDVAATAAVASDAELSNVGQAVIRRVDRVMGQGDGTVPLLSATRRTPLTQFPQANLNGKGAWLWRPPETSDQDHNGMLKNPAVHQFIIKVLDPDPDTPLPAGLEPAVP